MKLFNRFFPVSLLFFLLYSCAAPETVRTAPPLVGGSQPQISLEARMKQLRAISLIRAEGVFSLETQSDKKEGNFVLMIEGEDMNLTVYSNGFKAGEIVLKGNAVSSSPQIKDEYVEYMLGVALRDSVQWWDIEDYKSIMIGDRYLLRNSWKKIYLNEQIVPERQVIRLTGFREINVVYGAPKEFGNITMPSRVDFTLGPYDCTLDIGKLKPEWKAIDSKDQDRSPQF